MEALKVCNGYGDAPKKGRKYDWEFQACDGCAACAHLPRCQFCHRAARNVGGDLCGFHLDEKMELARKQEADRLATAKAVWKFYVPAGDLGISYEDEGPWRSYDLTEAAAGNTIREFLDSVNVSEVDQDGGDLNCYGFEDAPREVQKALLAAAGLTEEDL